MDALPRTKIRDQAAARIKEYIVARNLGPGDRLPTENEFAATLGISRLSVREATKALEFLGIVRAKTGVGLTVGQLELPRVAEHLGFHPAFQAADPRQLIDSRVILETGVLPHVLRRMADDGSIHARLQDLVDRFRAARDLKTWIALDIAFHRTLLESSGLAPLVAFGDLLRVFFQRFRESVRRAEWKAGTESHQKIVSYLAAGDLERATTELRSHIESHQDRIR